MNIHNINIIADYEIKLLRRSWLFRIFAILTLLFVCCWLIMFNTKLLNKYDMTWAHSSLPSFIAFNATYYYCIIQSFLVVFLAGRFLTRDKKVDTVEVFFVRPISNSDYILGKSWGVMRLFLSVNIVLLIIAVLLQGFVNEYPLDIIPFIVYFFSLSVISLLFMLGFSYVILLIVKSQPVMMMITLGYVAISFFYFNDLGYGIFDLFGVQQPALFSDITGIANNASFLLQRTTYLFLGVGLLTLTIARFPRIPQRAKSRQYIYGCSSVFLLVGIINGCFFYFLQNRNEQQREKYYNTAIQYASAPKIDIIDENICCQIQHDQFTATATITLKNPLPTTLTDFILYLNPGLKIAHLNINGLTVPFHRDNQIIKIDYQLHSEQTIQLKINYSGIIDERIAYLDMDYKERIGKTISTNTIKSGKRYAFLSDKYTLLTPEIIWYPTSIAPSNPASPYELQQDYAHYSLQITNLNGLFPISQGKRDSIENGFLFTNKKPLPSIALSIGNYRHKTITVDSIDYTVNYFSNHDFFSTQFTHIIDTIPHLIREQRESFERTENVTYPYSKIEITEVPVTFISYKRNWKGYSEFIHPEIIFYPEYGIGLNSDISTSILRNERWGNQDDKPSRKELEIKAFQEVVVQNFTNEKKQDWRQSNPNELFLNDMLFYYNGFFYSDRYPAINRILKTFIQNNSTEQRFFNPFIRNEDIANYYLTTHSFEQALSDTKLKPDILYEIVKLKATTLKYFIIAQIGIDPYFQFIQKIQEESHFKAYDFNEFISLLNQEYKLDITPYLEEWYRQISAPIIHAQESQIDKVILNNIEMYRITFMINNPSPNTAVISTSVTANENERRGRRFRMQQAQEDEKTRLSKMKFYTIPPHSSFKIAEVHENTPSAITIATYGSNNIPTNFTFTFDKVSTETSDTTCGKFVIDPLAFALPKGTLIIDDEDDEFQIINNNSRHKLRSFLQNLQNNDIELPYKKLNPWRMPTEWTKCSDVAFYGTNIRSAVYRKKGNGNSSVEWNGVITEAGYYELYIWNIKFNNGPMRHRGGGDRGGIQNYTITYDSTSENMELACEQEEAGWISMGRFDFEDNTNFKITLSDISDRNYIIADAIKLVKIE